MTETGYIAHHCREQELEAENIRLREALVVAQNEAQRCAAKFDAIWEAIEPVGSVPAPELRRRVRAILEAKP